MPSMLSPSQKYAAGGLIALSLNQILINKTDPISSISNDNAHALDVPHCKYIDPELWLQHYSRPLHLMFRSLDIEEKAWPGLERAFKTDSSSRNVRAFLRLLADDSKDDSKEVKEQELALLKAVDDTVSTLRASVDYRSKKDKHREYIDKCRGKFISDTESHYEMEQKGLHDPIRQYTDECREQMFPDDQSEFDMERKSLLDPDDLGDKKASIKVKPIGTGSKFTEKPFEEASMLSYQKKVSLLHELLSACLAVTVDPENKSIKRKSGYDSRHRVALRLLTAWLNINWITMEAIETIIASTAIASLQKEKFLKEHEKQCEKDGWANWKRGSMIGAAALTGGTIFAVTGGLAAPGIAAGVGALAPMSFHVAATAAATHIAVAASLGAAGAGLSGMKMASRIGNLEDFEFKVVGDNHDHGRLAVEILVSGFVFVEEDYIKPWEGQANNSERYALQWESKNLIAVSTAIQDWLTTQLTITAMKQGAMLTVLHSLVSALAWPTALLNVLDLIDSKWAIAIDRSDQAGIVLAEEVLLKGLQGQRPVTLIGFSLGARVIFKCLETLAKISDYDGAQLVERVVLLGSPLSIKDENWEEARRVVAGRFVNAYSTNDWMLGVVFRASLLSKGLAGMQAVDTPGIENVDVTEFVEGHSSYLWTTQRILEKIELDAYFPCSDATFAEQGYDSSAKSSPTTNQSYSSAKSTPYSSAKSSPTNQNKTAWDV